MKKEIKKQAIMEKRDYSGILASVISHIEQSKLRAFAEVNKQLLEAYWNIGKVLSGNSAYGKSVVENLSQDLKIKYPLSKGYSIRNLWNMKRFYETYKKLQTLSAELLFSINWSNHITILDQTLHYGEKEFYIKMCIKERWSNRELERQIDSSLFERYMLADKPEKVTALIPRHEQKRHSKTLQRRICIGISKPKKRIFRTRAGKSNLG